MRRTRLRTIVTSPRQLNLGCQTPSARGRRTEIANCGCAKHESTDWRQPPRSSLLARIGTSEVPTGNLSEGIFSIRRRSPQSTGPRQLRNGHPPGTSVKSPIIGRSFQEISWVVIPAVRSKRCVHPPVKLTPGERSYPLRTGISWKERWGVPVQGPVRSYEVTGCLTRTAAA